MNEQKTLDYARIAQAIGYIRENFKRQPGLDEIAGEVALSTAHFQRMFTEWAGISPKKFKILLAYSILVLNMPRES